MHQRIFQICIIFILPNDTWQRDSSLKIPSKRNITKSQGFVAIVVVYRGLFKYTCIFFVLFNKHVLIENVFFWIALHSKWMCRQRHITAVCAHFWWQLTRAGIFQVLKSFKINTVYNKVGKRRMTDILVRISRHLGLQMTIK